MIDQIATISTNNDAELGKLIGDAFRAVDETGVVMMETSSDGTTAVEIVDGVQYNKGLTNSHFVTSKSQRVAELENPYVLLVESPIDNIRQIKSVLEFVIKGNKSLLVIADIDQPVLATLAMNKVKGNLKINVINAPTYGVAKKETLDDLAMLTGATIINEDLGDDLDLINPQYLGNCIKSVTTDEETILQVGEVSEEVQNTIKGIKEKLVTTKEPYEIVKLEKRLARLAAKIAIVKVGANS